MLLAPNLRDLPLPSSMGKAASACLPRLRSRLHQGALLLAPNHDSLPDDHSSSVLIIHMRFALDTASTGLGVPSYRLHCARMLLAPDLRNLHLPDAMGEALRACKHRLHGGRGLHSRALLFAPNDNSCPDNHQAVVLSIHMRGSLERTTKCAAVGVPSVRLHPRALLL